jgi:FemAB-related protein (PEP-CTERM system-associated)
LSSSPRLIGVAAPPASETVTIRTLTLHSVAEQLPWLEVFVSQRKSVPLSLHPAWLLVLNRGLGHEPHCVVAVRDGKVQGMLPLAYVRSWLFGRFLVSLPYLNYGGVMAEDDTVARLLIDRAVELADQLRVRYLELRHEVAAMHPRLTPCGQNKVHMRLPLADTPGTLWDRIPSKVRNQVRKGTRSDLQAAWGRHDLLSEFYAVFSHNMRDLGTPVWGRKFFAEALSQFGDRSEICVVRADRKPVAAALLLHGWGVTEVPSASSLRSYNSTCANMLLYWKLLERAVERGQKEFDFGRSTMDSSTFRFKKQWGAIPIRAEWQCYALTGSPSEMRPQSARYQRLVEMWKRLPLMVSRLLGPFIVRGIP